MTGMKDLGKLGRGTDSLVIHANPWEALLLAAHGGSGSINPATGLLEFEDGDGTGTAGGASDASASGAPGSSMGAGFGGSTGNFSEGGYAAGAGFGFGGTGVSPAGPDSIGQAQGFGGQDRNSIGEDGDMSSFASPVGDLTEAANLSQSMDAMGPAQRTAFQNNRFDPNHPAVARGRAIDEGTVKAQSLIDRMLEAFNPVRTDPVSVVNSVVSTVAAPVGLAMTVGRALSEYALDQGWSIDYSYDSVMSGGDNSDRAQDLRRQIAEATGQPAPTPTPTTPVPEVAVTTSVPGYRSLLGDGYDGFRFLESSAGVNRSTRRFA